MIIIFTNCHLSFNRLRKKFFDIFNVEFSYNTSGIVVILSPPVADSKYLFVLLLILDAILWTTDDVVALLALSALELEIANEALVAKELDTALELDIANDDDNILFEPNGPNTFDPVIKEAVCAVAAELAVEANDAVPNKEPVKLPVKLPVLYAEVKDRKLELNELILELKEAVA